MNKELIGSLAAGKVAVMATDTVYGIVCSVNSESAVGKLYGLKNREKNPGTIIAANIQQLVDLGLDKEDLQKANENWPGPVSVILPAPGKLSYLHLGKDSLAVRVPSDENLQELLFKIGPLLTSSANLPGQPTSTDVKSAREVFGDKVDLYVDSGNLDSQPSTILRLMDDGFEKVR